MGLLSFIRSLFGKAPRVASRTSIQLVPAEAPEFKVQVKVAVSQQPDEERGHFESFMQDHAAKVEGDWFYSSIAGTAHRNDDGTSRQRPLRAMEVYDELELVTEPDNKFDPFAVRVVTREGAQLGYLPSRTADEVSRSFAHGERWQCFAAKIHGSGNDLRSARIALLRWDPIRLARPREEREFESFLSDLASLAKGYWFYADLIGIKGHGDEASSRRDLIRALKHREQLTLRLNVDDLELAKRVYLDNDQGEMLCNLGNKNSSRVIATVREGRRWVAMFRNCHESPTFKPYIALLCLGADASAQAKSIGNLWKP